MPQDAGAMLEDGFCVYICAGGRCGVPEDTKINGLGYCRIHASAVMKNRQWLVRFMELKTEEERSC